MSKEISLNKQKEGSEAPKRFNMPERIVEVGGVVMLALIVAVLGVVLAIWSRVSRASTLSKPLAPRTFGAANAAAEKLGSAPSSRNFSIPPNGPTCSISWTPVSPCQGDCHFATQSVVGTIVVNAPNCPTTLTSVTDCRSTMPCLCFESQLPASTQGLSPQVTTCSSCDGVPAGSTCQFACVDPTASFVGMPQIACLSTGWAQIDPENQPACLPQLKRCPNIFTDETKGIGVISGSTCANAVEGDTCGVYCKPGLARKPGVQTFATCDSDGNWVFAGGVQADLACYCQDGCTGPGSPDTCASICG